MVDMTKKAEEPKKAIEVPVEPVSKGFNFNVTAEELDDIKLAIANDGDFKTFVAVVRGQRLNKILVDLEGI